MYSINENKPAVIKNGPDAYIMLPIKFEVISLFGAFIRNWLNINVIITNIEIRKQA